MVRLNFVPKIDDMHFQYVGNGPKHYGGVQVSNFCPISTFKTNFLSILWSTLNEKTIAQISIYCDYLQCPRINRDEWIFSTNYIRNAQIVSISFNFATES